ncbi:MAG: serine/threonine protein kinase [Actinobacteria bacterium]|nr:serine/threonine protein kinase [Actinomycetota bacterium]
MSGDPIGALLGDRYRIIHLIATGGMARVYAAMDEVLSRPVAVKILHDHLAHDAGFVERFRREAIAAARLSHPSIVSIFDTVSTPGGVDEGVPYPPCEAIVMELVHGTTLRRRLDALGTLELDEAVTIGAQVADALDTAHRAHVVHRDIKPANILLSTDGRVLVADFGIAKAAEGQDLTAEGSMLGTAKYLAPEQVEGTDVDGRADIYALGIVLFEALCGRVPFLADTDTATALARLHRAPMRPRQVRADIPRSVDEVILRAMARNPEDRFADAAQFRAALLACTHNRPLLDITVDDTAPGTEPYRSDTRVADRRDRTPIPGPSTQHAPGAGHDVDGPDDDFGRSERAWLVPALLIVLVAVALAVVGILFGKSRSPHRVLGSSGEHTTTTVLVRPRITTVHAFDPEGDGVEDNADLPHLTDGNPDTVWHTDTYKDAPVFGVKDGVGLDIVLAGEAKTTSLVVDGLTSGWNASVYVSSGTSLTTLADWGRPVTSKTDITPGRTTFDLGEHLGDRILLWITRPGPSGRVTISEISVQ